MDETSEVRAIYELHNQERRSFRRRSLVQDRDYSGMIDASEGFFLLLEFAKENSKAVNDFTSDALELLMSHTWPGNVRELRAAMEHAVVLCRGEKISARDLPGSVRNGAAAADPARALARPDVTVKDAEKQLIARALKENDGNRTLAARQIGMSRRTFHRKLHQYHLEGF